MTSPWVLIADIGGTNARFAAYRDDRMVQKVSHATARGDSLTSLAQSFCRGFATPPAIAVAAVAGPVRNNRVVLTNAGQDLSADDLQRATGAGAAHIINDMAAAAWATLAVRPADLKVLAGPPDLPAASRVVVGLGTGLGVAALVRDGDSYHCQPGEGGHKGIGPQSEFEVAVFKALRGLRPGMFFDETLIMEAEGLLSGIGLPNVHQAIGMVAGQTAQKLDAEGIFNLAKMQSDPAATRAVGMFKTHLARFAGDLGLVFGAEGAVVLSGGLAQKNPWLFDQEFVDLFQSGGRFTPVRKAVALYLASDPIFSLLGAYHYAKMRAGLLA